MTDLSLTEFLLARISEDEALAEQIEANPERPQGPEYVPGVGRVALVGRGYLLAECEAKRGLLALHEPQVDRWSKQEECGFCWTDFSGSTGDIFFEPWPCPTVRLLALPYADHPDYRQEWKP